MAVQIGAKPESGPGDPLGWLSDCHRRIERFLDALLRVAEQARGGELSAAQRETLERGLEYFRAAAPLHTADEEASLFSRLRGIADQRLSAALDLVQQLERDHRVAEVRHEEVNHLGRRWLSDGRLSGPDAVRLIELLHSLRDLYAQRIEVEDNQVFPAARDLLPTEMKLEVGREMAARRGAGE